MNRLASMNRLWPRALVALYLREAPHVVLLSIAMYLSATLPPSWLGRWPVLVFSGLIALRAIEPLYRWYSRRYQVTKAHLTETAGVLKTRTRSLAWSDITAIEIHVPWSHRALGLAIVTVKTDGGPETTVCLDGVDRHDADEFRCRARGVVPGSTQRVSTLGVPAFTVAEQSSDVVYRASWADLLAASLFYGQFVVLAGVFIGALLQFAELFQAAPVVLGVFENYPVVSLGVLAVVGSAVGCGLTMVKFHGFSVAQDSHSIMLEHGLFNTQQRTVRRTDVIGIRLRRNLVEMLFDRVRVSLITTDSSQQLGTNLMLPSLSRQRVDQILSPLLPYHQAAVTLGDSGPRRLLPVTLATLLPIVLAASSFAVIRRFMEWSWLAEVLTAGATLLIAAVALRLATARFDFSQTDQGEILWRNQFGAQTQYILQLDAVHAATTVSLGPGEHESCQLFRLHFYTGMPKTLTAVVSTDHGLRTVEQAAARSGENIVAARKRKKVTP